MMRSRLTHVIVRSHHPRLRRGLFALGGLLAVLAGWLLFEYGRSVAGYSIVASLQKQDELSRRIGGLEAENERLRAQVAAFEQAGEIDRRAYEEVDRNLTDLQSELLELRQEVAFYRGIVDPNEPHPGLRAQSFKLRQEEGPKYQYRLVLTQLATTNAQIQGEAELTVSGMMNGAPADLSPSDLGLTDRRDLHFNLRHFQELKGTLVLPAGFVPLRVALKLTPKGAGSPVERTFNWAEAAS
jgi:hypothetical protein